MVLGRLFPSSDTRLLEEQGAGRCRSRCSGVKTSPQKENTSLKVTAEGERVAESFFTLSYQAALFCQLPYYVIRVQHGNTG